MSNAISVLRVFDYTQAIEFYVNWLGAKILWDHKPEGSPFYMQISLKGAKINLSQHHGDGSPGGLILLEEVKDLAAYQKELLAKAYPFMKPGLEKIDWEPNTITMTVIDPFYNRIIFSEKLNES